MSSANEDQPLPLPLVPRGEPANYHRPLWGEPSSLFPRCEREEALPNAQVDVHAQILNLTQKNHELNKKVEKLQRQVDWEKTANQRLATKILHEHEIKLSVHSIVQEQASFEYKLVHIPICIGYDNFQRPIYTFKPIYDCVPVVKRERVVIEQPVITVSDAANNNCRCHRPINHMNAANELRLRAVIGNQEQKIRLLTEKLALLQVREENQKVTTERDKEGINADEQDLNNNESAPEQDL